MKSMRDERGSLPLGLILVIIVGGMVATVTSRTLGETRAVGFDRDYTVALHAADAGVEQGLFILNNKLYASTATTFNGSGAMDGVTYSWTATKTSPGTWSVTSVGGPAGLDRTVRADIMEQPMFDVAAFAKDGVDLNGTNVANSYHSRLGYPTPTSHLCTWSESTPQCSTGFGLVGSNGNILYQNENSIADGTIVYNWTANSSPDRCQNSTILCAPPKRVNVGPPRTFDEELADIEDAFASCSTLNPAWRASDHTSGSTPALFNFAPGTHCFTELHFDKNVVLPSTVTADNPLKIYVRDFVVLGGNSKVEINCQGCQDGYKMPVASRLYLFTAANDGTTNKPREGVKIANQTDFAGAIMAPNASCGTFSGSNAGVDIYGSIVCKAIRNNGNWSFHYDEDLRDGEKTGRFAIANWTEQ